MLLDHEATRIPRLGCWIIKVVSVLNFCNEMYLCIELCLCTIPLQRKQGITPAPIVTVTPTI